MQERINKEEVIKEATLTFQKSKKYLRQKDMKLFFRCKFLNKNDVELLEQFALIHLKNIASQSKIEQNFYAILDNFIFDNFFVRHFFTSFEMFRIICYRISLLPTSLLLKDVKSCFRKLLSENAMKLKTYKQTINACYYLEPLPNLQSDIESFLEECTKLLSLPKNDAIILNPLNIILYPDFKSQEQIIKEFSKNLGVLFHNANGKKIIFDNDCMFFNELLESLESCIYTSDEEINLAISLPSYNLFSLEMLEKIIQKNKLLHQANKTKITVRLKDLNFNYDLENFKAAHSYKINTNFANHTNATSNLIALMQKCAEHKDILECQIISSNFFILTLAKMLDLKTSFEIEPELHYPFYKTIKQMNFPIIATRFYTKDFTQTFAIRLKSIYSSLHYGILNYITMLQNQQEWERKCNAFLHSFQNTKKEVTINPLQNINSAFRAKDYNFETFTYELRRGFKTTFTNNEQEYTQISSFANELDILKIQPINFEKLEDILYLNASDMHRLNMQSMNNIPATFSLHANKEKEALTLAIQKQEEIEHNRTKIMTEIIARLKEHAPSIFQTLCTLYPHTPSYIFEEQVYILIDTFKYYAYEYKQLLQETDSVLLIPLGNIFIHTKKLTIYEIASILASNIMIGNVSFLDDSVPSRILYYIFQPLFEFCTFLHIAERDTLIQQNLIHYEIIAKQDYNKYQYKNKFLVWDKGVSVIFISSFYDIHEASVQIQNMRFLKHAQILIYTDQNIYNKAKQIFIPLQVSCISLHDLIANLPENTSNFSLFTYNKAEMNYAINHLKISLCVNAIYRSKLVSGSPRTFSPGYLQPFGSKLLLNQLVQTSPNSVIRNNSLYSDIIGCFNSLLSIDEIEFLYNLNHNYTQFLKHIERIASFDNIYEAKKAYQMHLRVYKEDDFFHVCVIMLIAFLLQIQTKISFTPDYFSQTQNILEKLDSELQEKYIDIFTLLCEDEATFLSHIHPNILIRILQDEENFAQTQTYHTLQQANIIAEYSLPILNKNLELERYLATQYIQIEPNIFLEHMSTSEIWHGTAPHTQNS